MNKTKRKIFDTALKLFAEKGYASTSIEEITAISGVAKGTLYYHFSNKEEILDLLLDEGMKLLKNSIEIKTKDVALYSDKIKSIILLQIKVVVRYESLIKLVFSQMWGEGEQNIKCRKYVFEYMDILEKVIQEGMNNGELYEGDAKAIASEIFGITCSSLIYRMNLNEQVEVNQIYNKFIDYITRAIVKSK